MYRPIDRDAYECQDVKATTSHSDPTISHAVIDEARTSTVITRPRNLHYEQSRRARRLCPRAA